MKWVHFWLGTPAALTPPRAENFQTFLADQRILELRSPFSASCFNLQLIDVFTNLKDLVCNCGFAIAESIGDIYIFIQARIPKLFRDSSRPSKGGVCSLHTDIAHLCCRTRKCC